VARDKCGGDSDSVTEQVFRSELYRTHYPDEKPSPAISLSLLAQGHAMSSCLILVHSPRALRQGAWRSVSRQVIACRLAHGLGRARIVVVVLYESGLRGVPHINPHHAFPQHVQVKACTLNVITKGARKALARI
jgi:hypothetical protein